MTTVLDHFDGANGCSRGPDCAGCRRLREILALVSSHPGVPTAEQMQAAADLPDDVDEPMNELLSALRSEVLTLFSAGLIISLFATLNKHGMINRTLAGSMASEALARCVQSTGIGMPVAILKLAEDDSDETAVDIQAPPMN